MPRERAGQQRRDKAARSAPAAAASFDFDFIAALAFESPPVAKLRQRSVESRARILKSASEAFLRHGFEGVSTHDVAAEAGVTQGLIRHHFQSKDGLWKATMDDVFGAFRNNLSARLLELRAANDRAFIEQGVRHIVRSVSQFPTAAMLVTGQSNSAPLTWLLKRHIQPIFAVVRHILVVGQHKAIVRPLPVDNLYFMLMASSSVFALSDEIKLLTGRDNRSDAFLDAHTECLLSMLMSDAVKS